MLAIGQTIQERNGEKVVTGETATLELTPAQAETVTLAQKIGQLSLALRSLADAQRGRTPMREGRDSGLTVVRYGVPKQAREAMMARLSARGAPMRAARLLGRRCAGRLAAALCALVLMAGAPAAANGDFRGAAPPVVHVGAADQAVARSVDLSIGRSIIVELPRDAKEVFVANPKIANAVVRSTRKVFLIGMENGATSIFVMDGDGRQIAALEVIVGRDLNALRQTLRTALPQRPASR